MKETIKKSFIGGIVFLGTILTGFFSFAAYISLPTQGDGATITQTIWNDVINKINYVGNNVDTLSGSILGIGQTRQDVTASRVAGTTYTNTTGKPILVEVNTQSTASDDTILYVNDSIVSRFYMNSTTRKSYTVTAIVPNGSTYKCTIQGSTIYFWKELR